MLYRLLRNNKESGPFTALQLEQMGLKPYDLLWTEGKGAAWQYASEIPELKNFAPLVEEQPFDRFYKRKEALQTAQQPAVTGKKVKPRFRISNGQLIMVEPGNMEVANTGIIKETAQIKAPKEPVAVKQSNAASDWQDGYTQWQPQPQKKTIAKEEPVEVETKYSESLDDLKKRYAEKVLNEKATVPSSSLSSASVRQNIMAAVALVVLAVGGYIGYTLKQKGDAKADGKPAIERADIAGGSVLSSSSDDNETAGNTADEHANNVASQPVNERSTEGSTTKAASQKPVSKPAVQTVVNNDTKLGLTAAQKVAGAMSAKAISPTIKTAEKTTVLTDKKKESVKTNNSLANNIGAKTNTASSPTATIPKTTAAGSVPAPVETKPVVVKQNAPKKIDDYLSVKKLGGGTGGVQNVRLLVNNVTDFPIDLAVIDIQYFDSKGKYQKGETMYVKDINGGNNVELHVPDSDKSSSIKYKVSLVSAEKKTLYLVAD